MDIFEIRKANLIRLIGSRRKGACADKWEMAPAHLSQVLSNKTAKNLGEDVARRIELKEGLPHGWLDILQVGAKPEPNDSQVSDRRKQAEPTSAGESQGSYSAAHRSGEVADQTAALLATLAALTSIQAGLLSGQLTDDQVRRLLQIRNEIAHQKPHADRARRLQGLLAAAFQVDGNGHSPDDLLKMYQLGMEKEFAKEGAKAHEPGKKPARRS